MGVIQGTVLKKNEAMGGRNNSRYYKIKLVGVDKTYFCWKPELIDDEKIGPGTRVEITHSDGRFANIIRVTNINRCQQKTLTNGPATGYNPPRGHGF